MTLGEKIYQLRSEKGISQETMALDLNVSRQAVSKWETDQSTPDLEKIKLLSEYFQVSIDFLVKTGDIPKEQVIDTISNTYDANKIKRIVRMMLKTSIALALWYVVLYLLVVILQKNLSVFEYSEWVFVFPTIDFVGKLLTIIFIIVVAFIMLQRLKKDNKNIVFELVILLVYYIGISFVGSYLLGIISQNYINSLPAIDGIYTEIIYVKLVNQLSDLQTLLSTTTILFSISLISMMIVNKFDASPYQLPKERKEYKTIDSVLSCLNGVFLGIPGLLFQIIWLLDAKTDNVERFKKMRLWYIIGIIINIGSAILIFILELI